MPTAIVLFTRDLRVHDHPALATAVDTAEHVVPVFVVDERIVGSRFASPNRMRFLVDALADLRSSLRARGGDLVIRRGDPVAEVLALAHEVGAEAVHLSDDVSAHADRRLDRLRRGADRARVDVITHPGVTVVPPGEVVPVGGDHFRVFTPYLRAWHAVPWRACRPAPARLTLPPGLTTGRLPDGDALAGRGRPSPHLPRGGETEGRRRARAWCRSGLAQYAHRHDDLPGDATSRLSPYLHLGCVSPLALACDARDRPDGDAFVRQLCWRDFHHQVAAAFPALGREDYRPRGTRWRDDPDDLDAWRDGRTGYPIVDAGMRQLTAEGWMHNRARLVTASFLVKELGLDWRLGAQHFFELLVDGDVASNNGNWQWVAGTGNDTRPNRRFNPVRQAERFDPDGDYVRRYVPELAGVPGSAVHRPWRLPADARRGLDYPDPIVEHATDATSRGLRSGRVRAREPNPTLW
jgi:deoxyribodipyrimidine photo-lyase